MPEQKNNFVSAINSQFSESAAQKKAFDLQKKYVDLRTESIDYEAISLIPEPTAKEIRAIAFYKKDQNIKIATSFFPNEDLEQLCTEMEKKNLKSEVFICSNESFIFGLTLYESNLVNRKKIEVVQTFDENLPITINQLQQKAQELSINTTNQDKETEEKPIKTFLSEIYLLALSSKTSDIHFQPQEVDHSYLIRFRIDGVLHPVLKIPTVIAKKVLTEIKYSSGMRTNISKAPQDGRMAFQANGRTIEIRSSTLPSTPFESIVFRILDTQKGIKSFSDLGFPQFLEQKIQKVLRKKNGMILVTGPTGSGKTTTLYSMLKDLNTPERKIITLEDPIEYQLPGIVQSEISKSDDYNFDSGFSSILRHDPDVVLVGEMRDLKTINLGFEAALTGHTVLSSLHTNSAVGAISRLRNMGVQDFNIAPTINAIFSQKLARKTRPNAKLKMIQTIEAIKNPMIKKSIERIKKIIPTITIPTQLILSPENIETDFYGQIALPEAFILDDTIRSKILNKDSEYQIREYLEEKTDFLSSFDIGILKVIENEICINELVRVLG